MSEIKKTRYSKVDRRTWNDGKFGLLGPTKPSAQFLWFRLLTGPELGVIPGVIPVWEPQLACALRWSIKDFRRCFAKIEEQRMVVADWNSGLLWVPKAISHNEPPNPKVVLGWKVQWEDTPECALKSRIWAELDAYLKAMPNPSLAIAFREVCPNSIVGNRDTVSDTVSDTVPRTVRDNKSKSKIKIREEGDPDPERAHNEPAAARQVATESEPDAPPDKASQTGSTAQRLQARFTRQWEDHFGKRYVATQGKKDFAALVTLAEELPAEELPLIAEWHKSYLRDESDKWAREKAHPHWLFCETVNRYRVATAPSQSARPAASAPVVAYAKIG